jgi:hypothetical protein
VFVAAITRRLLSHCLATGVFAEPFPSNGCLCWLHSSGFQHTFHTILAICNIILLQYSYPVYVPSERVLYAEIHRSQAAPLLKRLVAGFPPRRPGFEPGSDKVRFVVDKAALGQVFSAYFGFPCQSSIHQIFHPHYHSGQVQ